MSPEYRATDSVPPSPPEILDLTVIHSFIPLEYLVLFDSFSFVRLANHLLNFFSHKYFVSSNFTNFVIIAHLITL